MEAKKVFECVILSEVLLSKAALLGRKLLDECSWKGWIRALISSCVMGLGSAAAASHK